MRKAAGRVSETHRPAAAGGDAIVAAFATARPDAAPGRAPVPDPCTGGCAAPAPGLLTGLAPIAAADARVLILGSFPGEASLVAQAYYGHPRNHFWRLVGGVVGEALDLLDDGARVRRLQAHGIAVWDVIARCERRGSLDSAIRAEVANDIGGLLRRCPRIATIAFNGGKSASYRKRVEAVPEAARSTLVRLPSSSPANATHSLAVKQAAWDAALRPALA